MSGQKCGAWMPKAKDWCARAYGHQSKHRTAAAMAKLAKEERARHETARQGTGPR